MSVREAFPWQGAMRLGFGVLGLSSKDFWSMTLRELAALFPDPNQTMTRATLDALMRSAPDGDVDAG